MTSTYGRFTKFRPSQHLLGHIIRIWVLGNQLVLTMIAASHDHHLWPSMLASHKQSQGEATRKDCKMPSEFSYSVAHVPIVPSRQCTFTHPEPASLAVIVLWWPPAHPVTWQQPSLDPLHSCHTTAATCNLPGTCDFLLASPLTLLSRKTAGSCKKGPGITPHDPYLMMATGTARLPLLSNAVMWCCTSCSYGLATEILVPITGIKWGLPVHAILSLNQNLSMFDGRIKLKASWIKVKHKQVAPCSWFWMIGGKNYMAWPG